MNLVKQHPDQRKGWLWWLAAVIFLAGGTASYLLFQGIHPETRQAGLLCSAGTLVAGGICIICATSEWWMRR